MTIFWRCFIKIKYRILYPKKRRTSKSRKVIQYAVKVTCFRTKLLPRRAVEDVKSAAQLRVWL